MRQEPTAAFTGQSQQDGLTELPDDSVTVILVNYHSIDNIRARLTSPPVRRQRAIVVDNGDDPEGVTALCHEHGRATPLLMNRNIGFAAAVNCAADLAAGQGRQPLLLLNPDAYITEEALTTLMRALEQGFTGAGPLLVETRLNRIQIGSGGGPLTLRSVIYYFLFLGHLFPRLRGVFLTRRQLRTARDVDWICMASLLVQPDAFTTFGQIPEDEIVYAEDIAWGTLASKRGARFRHVPEVRVLHESGGSGERHHWIGALERLCRRRLGPLRGPLAVAVIRSGLSARRILGRRVT